MVLPCVNVGLQRGCTVARNQVAPAGASYIDNDATRRRYPMSNLRVFDPLFSDSFDSALRRFFTPVPLELDGQLLKMRVDVTESDKGYAVKADIPGVKKEDISVRIDGNVVQIDAETRREAEEKGNGDK